MSDGVAQASSEQNYILLAAEISQLFGQTRVVFYERLPKVVLISVVDVLLIEAPKSKYKTDYKLFPILNS